MRKGFSLIEVLAAMAITAIIATSVYYSFSNLLTGRARVKEHTERERKIFFALDMIKRDIRNAFLTNNKGAPEQTHITIFKGDEDSPVSHLTFASLNHMKMRGNAKECDQTEIEYYGETINNKITLMRRESFWIDDYPEKGGNVYPILDDFIYVKFEYWDQDNREWRPAWSTESGDRPDQLPPKVKITMLINEADGDKKEFKIETIVNIKLQKPFTF